MRETRNQGAGQVTCIVAEVLVRGLPIHAQIIPKRGQDRSEAGDSNHGGEEEAAQGCRPTDEAPSQKADHSEKLDRVETVVLTTVG